MIVAVGSTEQKASRGHHALERATNGRLLISARSKPGEKAALSCGLNLHRVVDVLASFRREARQIVIADEVATVALSSQMFTKENCRANGTRGTGWVVRPLCSERWMLASELAPWNAEGIVALLHMQCTNTAYARASESQNCTS